MSANDVEPINNFETNVTRRRSRAPDPALRRRGHHRAVGGEPISRYDRRTHNTRHPAEGLARTPLSANSDITVAAVEDPWGDGRERLFVHVNRGVDLLEQERSHRRISEAAYLVGRQIQLLVERVGSVGGTNWCGASRIDPAQAQDLKAQRLIDDGKKIQAQVARIRDAVGPYDLRLLMRILGEGQRFEGCAALVGKAGERGKLYVASRFRDALEQLVEAWQGKGKARATPDDKHKGAAGVMDARQDAALAAGATLARLEGELAGARAAKAEQRVVAALEQQIADLRLAQGMALARMADDEPR